MTERIVAQRRLDTLLAAHDRTFALVKLDLQGAELGALRGLGDRLAAVEAILTEISLVPYNAGAPLMPEVMTTLAALGFALHDIVDELRHTDGSLLQVDGLFLRQTSRFRPQPPFWVDRFFLRLKADFPSFCFGPSRELELDRHWNALTAWWLG